MKLKCCYLTIFYQQYNEDKPLGCHPEFVRIHSAIRAALRRSAGYVGYNQRGNGGDSERRGDLRDMAGDRRRFGDNAVRNNDEYPHYDLALAYRQQDFASHQRGA